MVGEEELQNNAVRAVVRRGRKKIVLLDEEPGKIVPLPPDADLREVTIYSDLAARIARAKALEDPTPHCGNCWQRGRDAAIKVIEGGA